MDRGCVCACVRARLDVVGSIWLVVVVAALPPPATRHKNWFQRRWCVQIGEGPICEHGLAVCGSKQSMPPFWRPRQSMCAQFSALARPCRAFMLHQSSAHRAYKACRPALAG